MRRYWIESQFIEDQHTIHIVGDFFHHICEVCRQDVGSRFEVLTEHNQAYFVEIKEKNKKMAKALILEKRILPDLPRPHLHLLLSLPKFPVFESLLEKAVEMGIKSITPCFSDFSFVKSADKISAQKWDRWQKIIRSATQQSGRGDWLVLNPFMSMTQALELYPKENCIFAYEGDKTQDIRKFLKSKLYPPPSLEISTEKTKEQNNLPQDYFLIVGSEGGFSDQEVTQWHQLGLDPVSLGPQVLRVETACMALISILKYELNLMQSAGSLAD